MKRCFLLLVLFLAVVHAAGKEISLEQARKMAERHVSTRGIAGVKSAAALELSDAGDLFRGAHSGALLVKSAPDGYREIYAFNIGDGEGSSSSPGTMRRFRCWAMPPPDRCGPGIFPNVMKWLEGYRQQIRAIQARNLPATRAIEALWTGKASKSVSEESAVTPLLTTQWNQAPYVNALCPYDEDYGELTVTGCPATAMAQIMKYWNYPATGIGFHSYAHSTYGTLSANFGTTTYNWSAMPNVVNSGNLAVATLMYHCGVAVEMSYNVSAEGGSGSYVVKDPYGRYPDSQTCENAYVQFFDYSPTIQGIFRDEYTDAAWTGLMKAELDAGRPVQYAGFGQGGHTFVCDGYDANDFFHMNWGWGGYFDGYFLLDALNPGEGGIGSGAGTYNDGQQALIGIQPAQEGEGGGNTSEVFGLSLYSQVQTATPVIGYGDGFTVSADIANGGGADFTGDLCAAIFDEENAFIGFVELYEGVTLESGFYYALDFTHDGTLEMLPGNYRVYLFSRASGSEWSIISESYGGNDYAISAQIAVQNTQAIGLYSAISVTTERVVAQEALDISVEVGNWGATDFQGTVDINLFNLEGDFEMVIDQALNTSITSGFYRTYHFSTDQLDIAPGTYLLAVFHQPEGGEFALTGSTEGAPNPVKLIVQEPPYPGDAYESNDEVGDAFAFVPSWTNNVASIATSAANFHVGSDWDFFAIDLDEGYNYQIDMRLHDSYDSGDGNDYTVDGLFLYSFDGDQWTGTYDDVMPAPIVAEGGQTLYVVTSPYFLGETGTYRLAMDLRRISQNSAVEETELSGPSLFPNPCTEYLELQCPEPMESCVLLDARGRVIRVESIGQNHHILDVSTLTPGLYFLDIHTAENRYRRKVIRE
ncbi:MAG: C10 family peptidase [Bacteroidales bacterium]